MSKLRVYELAKELNIDNKILIGRIKTMGIDVQSHQSSLSNEDISRIRSSIASGLNVPSMVGSSSAASARETDSKKVVIRRRRANSPSEGPAGSEIQPAAEIQVSSNEQTGTQQVVNDSLDLEASHKVMATEEAVMPHSLETRIEGGESKASNLQSVESSITTSTTTSTSQPLRRVQSFSGATIVRKATAEELEQNKQREDSRFRRDVRTKEDSRGRRVASHDFSSIGRSSTLGGQGGLDQFPLTSDLDQERRLDKSKLSVEEEETESQKIAKKQKIRRANSTMTLRALLSKVDEEDGGVIDAETGSENLPEDSTASESGTIKTVYTPAVSATRKRDIKRRKDLKKTQVTVPRAAYRIVKMTDNISVSELARQLSIKATDIIKKLMDQGVMVTMNSPLDVDTTTLIANEYKFEVESKKLTFEDILGASDYEENPEKAESRPPIVTIMGHVDHGKTSILDAIRESNVAQGEKGGITQHIGAYTVKKDGKTIAFLDTPGHEAFSAMRARGAKVTDIVVLVVAADDGVMPQTIEAISHAKAADVPIVVAVNKMDKPNINLDRIYSELSEHGVQAEDWGGDIQFVKVSALKKTGLSELLEAILLQADVLELKADPTVLAKGSVIEAHLDKGRGPVATLMIQSGTLKSGQYLIAGSKVGRIRTMQNHMGQKLSQATPSTPVEIVGLSEVPSAGDLFYAIHDEQKAKYAVNFLAEQEASSNIKSAKATLDNLLEKIQESGRLEVPIIIKADTQGSSEAIEDALKKINSPKVSNRVIHRGVGGVNESDVALAEATHAVIVGFNVRAVRGLEEEAEHKGVVIKFFGIIYDLIDAVKAIMAGKLPPILKEVVQGHAQVKMPINIPKIGVIAGSNVLDGKVYRNSIMRVIRDEVVIYQGKISSLKRFKDDVKEVASGYECGIGIEGYNDLREGDVLEAFEVQEHVAQLE